MKSDFGYGLFIGCWAGLILTLLLTVMVVIPEHQQNEAKRACQQLHYASGRLDDRYRIVCDGWKGEEVVLGR